MIKELTSVELFGFMGTCDISINLHDRLTILVGHYRREAADAILLGISGIGPVDNTVVRSVLVKIGSQPLFRTPNLAIVSGRALRTKRGLEKMCFKYFDNPCSLSNEDYERFLVSMFIGDGFGDHTTMPWLSSYFLATLSRLYKNDCDQKSYEGGIETFRKVLSRANKLLRSAKIDINSVGMVVLLSDRDDIIIPRTLSSVDREALAVYMHSVKALDHGVSAPVYTGVKLRLDDLVRLSKLVLPWTKLIVSVDWTDWDCGSYSCDDYSIVEFNK
ncbi:MAG: hypothetical protein GY861_21165 [bacterium]|nr:hypothetical protein [bacterium]